MPTLEELIQQKRNEQNLINQKTVDDYKIDISNWGLQNNFTGGIYRDIPIAFGPVLHEWLMTLDVKNSLARIGDMYELHIDWTQKISDEPQMIEVVSQPISVPNDLPIISEPLPPEQA